MEKNNQNEKPGSIVKIFIGIVAGIIAFAIVFFFISILNSGNHRPGDIETGTNYPILVGAITGSLVAGFFAAVTTNRTTLINSAIIGIVLLLIWLGYNNFNFSYGDSTAQTCAFLVLPLTIIGGWLGVKYKTRKKSA